MTHNIQPTTPHSVVNLKIAVPSTNEGEISDFFSEFLGCAIEDGNISDYSLLYSEKPAVVVSNQNPDEGELFDQLKTYNLCIENENGIERWIKIETELALPSMNQDSLLKTLSNKIKLNQGDKITLLILDDMERVTLTEDDLLSPFCVTLLEESETSDAIEFYCLANDLEHAKEQAVDAYPGSHEHSAREISLKEYPYSV